MRIQALSGRSGIVIVLTMVFLFSCLLGFFSGSPVFSRISFVPGCFVFCFSQKMCFFVCLALI